MTILPKFLPWIAIGGVVTLTALTVPHNWTAIGNRHSPFVGPVKIQGSNVGGIKEYAKSKGLLVDKIVQRESGYRNIKCNYNPKCTEYGPAQYKEPTFKQYCSGDWKDPYDQIDCLKKMLDKGLCYHWTTCKP